MSNPKIIGVTGSSGFIGRHTVSRLERKRYNVKVLVRKADNFSKSVEEIRGDLTTGEGLDEFLNNVDILLHLAARQLSPEGEMFRDNVEATANLINAAFHHNLSQVIYLSTVVVYGEGGKKPFKEIDGPRPSNTYGLTKYLGESLVKYWGTKTGKPATILRPFNIYGPGNQKGIIHSFYKVFKETGFVTIYGDGKQKRDFLYVDDLVCAILTSIEKRADGTFNLGAGKSVSLLELIELFGRAVGEKPRVEFQNAELGKVKQLGYSVEKARQELNWTATISLEDGLKKTVQWYQQNP